MLGIVLLSSTNLDDRHYSPGPTATKTHEATTTAPLRIQRSNLKGRQALRQMGIDRFPRRLKLEVLELKKEIEEQAQQALDNLDEALRQLNRSPNLDAETRESTKRRREYLDRIHAPVPRVTVR